MGAQRKKEEMMKRRVTVESKTHTAGPARSPGMRRALRFLTVRAKRKTSFCPFPRASRVTLEVLAHCAYVWGLK